MPASDSCGCTRLTKHALLSAPDRNPTVEQNRPSKHEPLPSCPQVIVITDGEPTGEPTGSVANAIKNAKVPPIGTANELSPHPPFPRVVFCTALHANRRDPAGGRSNCQGYDLWPGAAQRFCSTQFEIV